MAEENCPLSMYNKRNFDYYEIEWVIENFSLVTCKKKWSFRSEDFTARGFNTTEWSMTISSTSYNLIQLSLKRSDSDDGPDKMWVDWRINICGENCDYHTVNTFCCFQKGTECIEDLMNEVSIIETMKPFEPDSLIVRCKFILYGENLGTEYQLCRSKDIKCLSENFFHLFQTSQNHDLELTFNDKTILAHKIIACSRIRKLNYLLEQERWKARGGAVAKRHVIDLSYLSYIGVRKVLEYVYSGNLKYVLAEPSLAVSDCVWKLDMSELKPYYTPNTLFFRTSVESHEINFKWILPNFLNETCHDTAMSPVLTDDQFGTTWKLHIFQENEANTDYFAVYAESLEVTELMSLCLEVAITEKSGGYIFPRKLRCSTNNGLKMFGFGHFVGVSAANSLADGDCLRIVVRLRLSEGVSISFTERRDTKFLICIPGDESYSLLSSDMESVFTSGDFSDLYLENKGAVYRIHKCIVAARCSEMYDKIRRMEESDSDSFPDIESDVFFILLKYLYTGALRCGCDEHFLKLYKIAKDFNLSILRDSCFESLQVLMEDNTALREQVLEYAVQSEDEALGEAVMRFGNGE